MNTPCVHHLFRAFYLDARSEIFRWIQIKRLTPYKNQSFKDIGIKKYSYLLVQKWYEIQTNVMLSGSVAQAPTALVTLTKSAWFVPVKSWTNDGIPPDFRITIRFSGSWAHSPKAPTTLTRTSSGWSLSKATNCSIAFNSWNLKLSQDVNNKKNILTTFSC